jgi:superfamily II DNA helicase RecQ
VTLKTGGGKSMLWTVPPVLDPTWKCIVVCPFAVLLEDQYRRCEAAGIACHNYCLNKNFSASATNVLFVQVEHLNSNAFKQ